MTCENDHIPITFEGGKCPLCDALTAQTALQIYLNRRRDLAYVASHIFPAFYEHVEKVGIDEVIAAATKHAQLLITSAERSVQ
ncbi:MAG TPA: hypothetical protein VD994_17020 [Prosthecobacter sp.]|nr:hypothetical protein [Prosthecobacter sp.]